MLYNVLIYFSGSTCFQGFFNYPDMQPILRHFCVYHMNCPGQQEGSLPLPQGYVSIWAEGRGYVTWDMGGALKRECTGGPEVGKPKELKQQDVIAAIPSQLCCCFLSHDSTVYHVIIERGRGWY